MNTFDDDVEERIAALRADPAHAASAALLDRLKKRLAEVEKERDFVRSHRPAQRRITELEDELELYRADLEAARTTIDRLSQALDDER